MNLVVQCYKLVMADWKKIWQDALADIRSTTWKQISRGVAIILCMLVGCFAIVWPLFAFPPAIRGEGTSLLNVTLLTLSWVIQAIIAMFIAEMYQKCKKIKGDQS